jgi:hypothetical protein
MKPVADFLRNSLANGALAVAELEARARAAGLLSQRQQIQHAKTFKKAKSALGIRSIRDGFGGDGKWAWHLPPEAIPLAKDFGVTLEAGVKALFACHQHTQREAQRPSEARLSRPK